MLDKPQRQGCYFWGRISLRLGHARKQMGKKRTGDTNNVAPPNHEKPSTTLEGPSINAMQIIQLHLCSALCCMRCRIAASCHLDASHASPASPTCHKFGFALITPIAMQLQEWSRSSNQIVHPCLKLDHQIKSSHRKSTSRQYDHAARATVSTSQAI